MGQVQHYFGTKTDMLRFACAYMVDRTRQAIADAIASRPEASSARDALRATLLQILPLDQGRRSGRWVWLAFLARGGVDPVAIEAMRSTWHDSHAYIAAQLRQALETGELASERDPDAEAVTVLSFVDGLSSHVLVGHYSAETAVDAIDRYLDRLLIPAGGK